jgi:hypothetical protein
VVAPDRRDAVDQRQVGIGMVGRQRHGEVVGDEGVGQAAIGNGQEQELPAGRRPRQDIQATLPVCAPISGSTLCASAIASARMRATWPSS